MLMDSPQGQAGNEGLPAQAAPSFTPRHRGTTTVPASVVARIAEQAASEVSQVGAAAGGLLGVGSRRNFNARPSVECELYGQVAVLRMDVGMTFPTPLAPTAHRLREHVSNEVSRMTGLDVRRVDVDISWLDPTKQVRGALR